MNNPGDGFELAGNRVTRLYASSNLFTIQSSIASRHMRSVSVTVIKDQFFKMNRKKATSLILFYAD
jgi:hypothetical protein